MNNENERWQWAELGLIFEIWQRCAALFKKEKIHRKGECCCFCIIGSFEYSRAGLKIVLSFDLTGRHTLWWWEMAEAGNMQIFYDSFRVARGAVEP